MDAYIIRRTLKKEKPRYQLSKISISGLCLPGSLGIENGVKQKLIADPVRFPPPPLKITRGWMALKTTNAVFPGGNQASGVSFASFVRFMCEVKGLLYV